jgi:hypothetical protein
MKCRLSLTPEDENKMFSYMTWMQFIGLGLTSTDVRRCVFNTFKETGDKTLRSVTHFFSYSCDMEFE